MNIDSLTKKIGEATQDIQSNKPKQIFYVPFEAAEDPKIKGKSTVYEDAKAHRDVISVRVFAIEVQKAKGLRDSQKSSSDSLEVSSVSDEDDIEYEDYDEGTPPPALEFKGMNDYDARFQENYALEDEMRMSELWNEFEKLDGPLQQQVLQRVAEKTPLLIRHGEPMPKLEPTDVINVMAHGKARLDYIGTVPENQEGIPEGQKGKIMRAPELVERMEQDLGKDLQKIKLNTCGSGGLFVEALHQHCSDAEPKHFPGALIRGYDGELVNFYSPSKPLWNLDKGSRYDMSGEGRKAYKAAEAEFDEAQDTVTALRKVVEQENTTGKDINRQLFPDEEAMNELNAKAETTKAEFHKAKSVRDEALVKWKQAAATHFSPAKLNRQDAKVGEQYHRSAPPAPGGGQVIK